MRYLRLINTCARCTILSYVIQSLSIILFYGLGCTTDVRAQIFKPPLVRNAVYAELLGPGLFYSLNYDYRFREDASVRIGVSVFPSSDNSSFSTGWFLFPSSLNYFVSAGDGGMELSLGAMPGSINGKYFGSDRFSSFVIIGISNIGVRYQPRRGGLVLRAGFTPLFTFSGFFAVTVGFSGGVAF